MRRSFQTNRARLQVEALESRDTPSSLGPAPFFPHNPGFPIPPGQTADHPAPIPMATGAYLATVSLPGLTSPIVVPVNIDFQAGARFATTISGNGLQIDLQGELNPAQGQAHFQCTIWSNGQKVGTASGAGSFGDPTGCGGGGCMRGQIDSFAVTFTFTMAGGSAGSGTASLQRMPQGPPN